MQLVVAKLPYVAVAIWVVEGARTLTDAVDVTPRILSPIGPLRLPLPMRLILQPLTLVPRSILIDLGPLPLSPILLPLPVIRVAIRHN